MSIEKSNNSSTNNFHLNWRAVILIICWQQQFGRLFEIYNTALKKEILTSQIRPTLKRHILETLKFTGFLFLGLLFLWLAFRGVKLNELFNIFMKINYGWIGLSLVFVWFRILFRAWRWKLLIESLGHRVTLADCYHGVAIGYLANFAFPRIGEITRCVVVQRRGGLSFLILFSQKRKEQTL